MTYPASMTLLQPGVSYCWTVKPVIDLLGSPASETALIVGGAKPA